MNANIKFKNQVTEENAFDLNQLADLIESDYGLAVERQQGGSESGVKDGGLVIGLTLALSAISTLVSVLAYWQSTRSKYSVTVSRGDVTYTIDNLPPDQLENIASKLEAPQLPEYVEVVVDVTDNE